MTAKTQPCGERRPGRRALQIAGAILLLPFFGCSSLAPIPGPPAGDDTRCASAKVRLLNRALDGEYGLTPAAAFGGAEDNEKIHLLIRFDRPLSLDQHEALDERGIELLEYIENCVYIVSLTEASWLDFTRREGDFGKLLGPLKSVDKIGIDELDENYFKWAADQNTGRLEVLIGFHRDVADTEAKKMLADNKKSPGVVYGTSDAPRKHGPRSWAAVVEIKGKKLKRIKKIAENDLVRWVEQGPTRFVPLNNAVRPVVNTDVVQGFHPSSPSPGYQNGGDGVRIGICDSGVDENHIGIGPARVYDIQTWPVEDSDTHGTFVASIAAGNGAGSADHRLRGHAPEAEIGDYPQCGSYEELYKDAIVDCNTSVTNHSYEQSEVGAYGQEAQDIDRIAGGGAEFGSVRIPARPQVWGAGNSGSASGLGPKGYYSIKAPAKNPIVVGSIDTVDRRLSSFSSLGPTWDGRIKPDIVAPGCRKSDAMATSHGIWTAKANTTNSYAATKCGTSFAAPVVAGIIALMIEEFRQAYYWYPGLHHLRPATFKAMLVNTAVDLVKTQPYDSRDHRNPDTGEYVLFHRGPDLATGFGVVDAFGACQLVRNMSRWIQSSIGSSGERDHWCIPVTRKTDDLKVTLAWDDEPGTISRPRIPRLVNDLDLALVSPGGEIFRPWTVRPPRIGRDGKIDPSEIKPAVRAEDHLNNVEMASVSCPEPGIWHVVVDGYFLKFGTSQDYSLAASAGFLRICPEPPVDICDRYPKLCPPREVCGRYPWFCQATIPAALEIDDRVWNVDPGGPAPVREICAFLPDCPECEGQAWRSCPGWQMVLDGVPEGVTAVLFDQGGQILQEVTPPPDAPAARRVGLTVDGVFPGQELYIGFVGPEGGPYADAFSARIDLAPLKELAGEEAPPLSGMPTGSE